MCVCVWILHVLLNVTWTWLLIGLTSLHINIGDTILFYYIWGDPKFSDDIAPIVP